MEILVLITVHYQPFSVQHTARVLAISYMVSFSQMLFDGLIDLENSRRIPPPLLIDRPFNTYYSKNGSQYRLDHLKGRRATEFEEMANIPFEIAGVWPILGSSYKQSNFLFPSM